MRVLDGVDVGASLNFSRGIECVDLDGDGALDHLVLYRGERMNYTSESEITAAQHALQDGELTFLLADGIGGNENDPDFAKFSSAGCPGLESI